MRTTLDIADDVLFAAKEIAKHQRTSVGAVVSDLARQAMLGPVGKPRSEAATARRLAKAGIHVLPHRGGIVTNELVNRIRDEEGI